MSTATDPIAEVPDPDTIRRMISENVRHTQLLRQLLRLSLSKHGRPARPDRATDAPLQGASHVR